MYSVKSTVSLLVALWAPYSSHFNVQCKDPRLTSVPSALQVYEQAIFYDTFSALVVFKTKVLKTKTKTLNTMHLIALFCNMALLEDRKSDKFLVCINRYINFF